MFEHFKCSKIQKILFYVFDSTLLGNSLCKSFQCEKRAKPTTDDSKANLATEECATAEEEYLFMATETGHYWLEVRPEDRTRFGEVSDLSC